MSGKRAADSFPPDFTRGPSLLAHSFDLKSVCFTSEDRRHLRERCTDTFTEKRVEVKE